MAGPESVPLEVNGSNAKDSALGASNLRSSYEGLIVQLWFLFSTALRTVMDRLHSRASPHFMAVCSGVAI